MKVAQEIERCATLTAVPDVQNAVGVSWFRCNMKQTPCQVQIVGVKMKLPAEGLVRHDMIGLI